jgi:hypothetical protein
MSSSGWIHVFLRILAIAFAAAQALTHAQSISSLDGISYIEIGEAYFRADWNAALSAYWSPLYSWILGLFLTVSDPSPFWEFAVVEVTNFVIFLFVLFSFDFFLQVLLNAKEDELQKPAWISAGYALFFVASFRWIRVSVDSPDLLLSGIVYLAAGMLLKQNEYTNRQQYATFGIVLGLGYLAKAAFLPVAIVFLLSSIASFQHKRKSSALVRSILLVGRSRIEI